MKARPVYSIPFENRQRVIDFEQRYLKGDAKSPYPDSAALAAGQAILNHEDERGNLRIIFRWKLQSFLKRFKWVTEFPSKEIPDNQIREAMDVARNADGGKPRTIKEALQVLDALAYVGIPVASAFLTAIHPSRFTVIDRQAYKALCVAFPNLRPDEYLCYLDFCKEQATRLGVSLRSYDRALWQYGSEVGRSRRYGELCNKEADRRLRRRGPT